METEVVSKTIRHGPQHWQLNADGSWSVLAFGSFGPNDVGLRYGWIAVPTDKVPKDVKENPKKGRNQMFEGETTIKFSKEAAMLMLTQNLSDMFKMPLEVTAMDMTYSGLEVTFGPPQEQTPKEPEPDTELEIQKYNPKKHLLKQVCNDIQNPLLQFPRQSLRSPGRKRQTPSDRESLRSPGRKRQTPADRVRRAVAQARRGPGLRPQGH
jgi:hypothetical protein